MSLTEDGWRKYAAQQRAEGHAAGVAEGRRLERADMLAWLRRLGIVSREMVSALQPGVMRAIYEVLVTVYEGGALYVARGGHVGMAFEGAAESAPPVAPEAPTSASVTRDVAAPAEGAAGGQDERGGQEP